MKSYLLALACVKGKYIVLADNDNVWAVDRLSCQVKYLQTHPNVTLVYSDCYVCDQDLKIINPSFLGNINRHRQSINYTDTSNHSFAKFLEINHVPGVSIMFHQRLLPFAKKNPVTIIHDHWLALVSSSLFKIGYISQPLVYYRLHSQNLVGLNPNSYSSFLGKIANPSIIIKYRRDKQNLINTLKLLSKLIQSPADKQLIRLKITELSLLIIQTESKNYIESLSSFSYTLCFLLRHHYFHPIKYSLFILTHQLIKPFPNQL